MTVCPTGRINRRHRENIGHRRDRTPVEGWPDDGSIGHHCSDTFPSPTATNRLYRVEVPRTETLSGDLRPVVSD